MAPTSWTRENVRHAASLFRYDRHPAATVYDSLGTEFFLALAPGWLNLGLWEGDGSDPDEAPVAVRRLVERLASELPIGGDVLDVGNGLAEQDPLIAEVSEATSLTALNITLSQLQAGAARLAESGARPVNADATRMPLRDASFDGLISVEAAFHFPSRARFFSEAFRLLRPGGVLSMSDIPTRRMPRGPREMVAALTQLRVWGLGVNAAATEDEIIALALGCRLRRRAHRAGGQAHDRARAPVRARPPRPNPRRGASHLRPRGALPALPGGGDLAARHDRLPAAARDETGRLVRDGPARSQLLLVGSCGISQWTRSLGLRVCIQSFPGPVKVATRPSPDSKVDFQPPTLLTW